MKEKTELYRTDWNGVLLEILYEPLWMPAHVTGEDLAHIDAASIQRQSRCRSPITFHFTRANIDQNIQ